MPRQALFAGLVIDEFDHPVEVAYVGNEPCYVVEEAVSPRHTPAETVDRQVLESMREMIEDHEDIIADQTAKMLGQEDPFSRAMIESQLKQLDQQFDALLETGIPEESRAYMGMMGFQVKINMHGDVLGVEQPGAIGPEDEGE